MDLHSNKPEGEHNQPIEIPQPSQSQPEISVLKIQLVDNLGKPVHRRELGRNIAKFIIQGLVFITGSGVAGYVSSTNAINNLRDSAANTASDIEGQMLNTTIGKYPTGEPQTLASTLQDVGSWGTKQAALEQRLSEQQTQIDKLTQALAQLTHQATPVGQPNPIHEESPTPRSQDLKP
jgi:hypothetical protein